MGAARAKLVLGSVVLAGAVSYLGLTGLRAGWVYYVDVDAYAASQDAQAKRARVHGVVSAERLDARPADLAASFTLLGETASVPVRYRGAVPDLFGAGRQVVVEGTMGPDGVLEADVLLTKCASKYDERAEGAAGGAP